MTWVVEALLPLRRRDGQPYPPALFEQLQRGLTARFGGATAYTRAPAKGLWDDGHGAEADDVVLLEVMTRRLDRAWWRKLRTELETILGQDEILLRAHRARRL